MRLIAIAALLVLTAATSTAKTSSADRAKSIVPADGLRTEDKVREFAIGYAKYRNPSLAAPYVHIVGLSRAPSIGGGRFTGEPVWLVEIFNAAVTEVAPMPQELVWIRARDGAVVIVGDTGE